MRATDLARDHGVRVRTFVEDLSAPAGAKRLHRAIAEAGIEVGILVNNAGVPLYGQFRNTDLAEELRMMELNMTALVELTKYFLPAMLARRDGRVLNVASTAAFVPGPWMSVYYATKAFVLSFSEAIAYELRGTGVTVTALCPGPTESEFKTQGGSQRSRLFQGRLMDAGKVARAGYDGMMKGSALVIPGLRSRAVPLAARVLPRSTIVALSDRASKPGRPG
jgi:short-subunit dehydrogenase